MAVPAVGAGREFTRSRAIRAV